MDLASFRRRKCCSGVTEVVTHLTLCERVFRNDTTPAVVLMEVDISSLSYSVTALSQSYNNVKSMLFYGVTARFIFNKVVTANMAEPQG